MPARTLARELANIKLAALRKLHTLMHETEDPAEARRCAAAILRAPAIELPDESLDQPHERDEPDITTHPVPVTPDAVIPDVQSPQDPAPTPSPGTLLLAYSARRTPALALRAAAGAPISFNEVLTPHHIPDA